MVGIFISYNHLDKEFARRIARDLRRENIHVWIDVVEMKIGDSLLSKIQFGIEKTDYLVAILSPRSVKSRWVNEELEMAMNLQIGSGRVRVLPVILEPCDIPLFLQGKKCVDFSQRGHGYREGFYELCRAVLPNLPAPVFMTARQAAREARIRFTTGYLAAISHIGTASHFYTRSFARDFYYADAKSGMSRVWCIEFYRASTKTIHPFSVDDGEWMDWGEGRSSQGYRPIDFPYIDSDLAVSLARQCANRYSVAYQNDENFFVLTKLRYFNEQLGHSWLVGFYDGSLSASTYVVRVNARTGVIQEEGPEDHSDELGR